MGNFYTRLIALWFATGIGAAHAGCAPDAVELRSESGVKRFAVEIADSPAERELGLMNRKKMPSSAGMLFVYEKPTHAYFWMKDTLIPLDMIFADSRGQVTRVHSNAVPMDLSPIDGGADVRFVLEINAGLAKSMQITEGSVLKSKEIAQTDAIWPCNGE